MNNIDGWPRWSFIQFQMVPVIADEPWTGETISFKFCAWPAGRGGWLSADHSCLLIFWMLGAQWIWTLELSSLRKINFEYPTVFMRREVTERLKSLNNREKHITNFTPKQTRKCRYLLSLDLRATAFFYHQPANSIWFFRKESCRSLCSACATPSFGLMF